MDMNTRNQFGLKDSIAMYRTINGVRFIQWTSDVTKLEELRAAGVRCALRSGEVFIHPDDQDKAA